MIEVNPGDKALIKESIQKWERVVRYHEADGDHDVGNDGSSGLDCALCRRYYPRFGGEGGCTECPVGIKTGEWSCNDSPYKEYSSVFFRRSGDHFVLAALARMELNFLQDLLAEAVEPYEEEIAALQYARTQVERGCLFVCCLVRDFFSSDPEKYIPLTDEIMEFLEGRGTVESWLCASPEMCEQYRLAIIDTLLARRGIK